MFKFIKNMMVRTRNRGTGELLKHVELELLGKHASTYCYHHPSHVLVELTTRCNLRCSYCNQNNPKWQKAYGHNDMPFELFEKIVPQLKGSQVILLYNIGEPLLYKHDIYRAIKLAKQYIPEVRITSNGMLWTREVAQKLEQAGLSQMNISIDSPDPIVMERNRGADLDKIEKNLLDFGETCNIPVETWSVITKEDADSLERLPEWASQFPAIKSLYFQLLKDVDSTVVNGKSIIIEPDQFIKLGKIISEKCEKYGLKTNISSIPYYLDGFQERQARGICKAPFNQLTSINVRGYLVPCCSYATYELGNVTQDGFKQVWNNNKTRQWRQDMLDQNYCSYCSKWCGFKQNQREETPIIFKNKK